MLEIRKAQFQAFHKHAEKDFRRRLHLKLRREISLETMGDEEMDAHIEAGITQARDCRLTREIDVARFVEAVCTRLGGFPANGLPKPALPILYAYGISPQEKVDRFISWCYSQNGR
jgi:uncharacterized membrane protein